MTRRLNAPTRRQRVRLWLILLVAFLVLPACGAPTPGNSTNIPPVSPTVMPGGGDPRAVYERLRATPFASDELPAGDIVEQSSGDDRPGPPGAIGEVGFKLDLAQTSASTGFDVILYGVFATPDAAAAAFAQGPAAVLDPTDHYIVSSGPAPGRPDGTTLYHVKVTDIHGGGGAAVFGYSYCSTRVGAVIVTGGSGMRGDRDAGDDARACTLADAAVVHLQRVSSGVQRAVT
ncbi:MAG: hypothetical protein LC793_06210 [Thermomicrobia bacterium]|nr:hypothetical protein [Thermomicrobia bacterium]